MPRYIPNGLGVLFVALLAGMAGYYFARHRKDADDSHLLELSVGGYLLEDGRHSLLTMELLTRGRNEDAYSLAAGRALLAFQYLHYWPPPSSQQAQTSRAFAENVIGFYRLHPERRQALAQQHEHPDLLQWIDGKP